MIEIGGYLCLDTYNMPMRHAGAIALNSGRNCLAYLIEKKKIKKIFIPKFLCASVGDVCKRYGVEVEYYSINIDFSPDINNVGDGWLYVVNYYGQVNNEMIIDYKRKYDNVIVDNVQAYFQESCIGIDTIYSCRKFLGVTDGAFLYSDVGLDCSIEVDESWNRAEHLIGSYEKGASCFFSGYSAMEESYEKMPVRRMSRLTTNLLHGVDYEYVKRVRTENFLYLCEHLCEINKLKISAVEGPYMYPLYIENGTEIRKNMQQKRIFVPILWPDVLKLCNEDELEYDLARNILPLPVDQRYGIEDMDYIVSALVDVMG